MQELPFETVIYDIKEIRWRHNMFKEFKNKNILMIIAPFTIMFAAL